MSNHMWNSQQKNYYLSCSKFFSGTDSMGWSFQERVGMLITPSRAFQRVAGSINEEKRKKNYKRELGKCKETFEEVKGKK